MTSTAKILVTARAGQRGRRQNGAVGGRKGTIALLAIVVAAVLLPAPAGPTRSRPDGRATRWDLAAVGAVDAWARGGTGSGTRIAIVDSGIDLDHPALRNRIRAGATCVATGGDPARCRGAGDDVDGHGTHVAGIASAVAPDAELLAVRVLSSSCDGCSPRGSAVDVSAGIKWATAHGADVVNLSVDTVDGSLAGPAVAAAVEHAWAAGVVVVAASGNRSADGAVAQPTLVVTGTDRSGNLAGYAHGTARSPWGLAAPGGADDGDPTCRDATRAGISSTWIGGGRRCLSGTSMAAPHVAGAVADLRSMGYAPADAVDRLIGSARAIRPDGAAGVGALDLAAASGPGSVIDPIVSWPEQPGRPAEAAAADPPLEALPPVLGGAVMGLCAAVALLVLRDMRRRPHGDQSLVSGSA
jgi:subtilisin family serine protease